METTDNPAEFLVRFSRAHAWVEAVLDGSTWTTLDATPAQRDFAGNYLLRLLTTHTINLSTTGSSMLSTSIELTKLSC